MLVPENPIGPSNKTRLGREGATHKKNGGAFPKLGIIRNSMGGGERNSRRKKPASRAKENWFRRASNWKWGEEATRDSMEGNRINKKMGEYEGDMERDQFAPALSK